MDSEQIAMPLALAIPFLGAALAGWSARYNRLAAAAVSATATLSSLLLLLPGLIGVFSGQTLVLSWPWLPQLGLDFGLRLDGLSALFVLMILIIGLLVILYARYYLSSRDSMGRFFAYMMLFMGSMLGVVLSENLLQMLIFWEMTSLSSFLLISYWQHRADARQGARLAMTITGGGGLALLAGILLLGHIVGSYNLTDVLTAGEIVRNHPWYLPTLVLIALGVFTKSAQFPFHFWLPNAMAAPTPVSAYLHSATMVKAGIFLLARFFPVLSGTQEWIWLIGGAGMVTLLVGAYTALFQHDLKGLLAYSTISHLGLITLLFGLGTQLAAVAALFHIINHATFKASLFMVAGIIDHETGSRDMRKINGLLRYLPHTATLAIIASLAMAGVPLLNGFLSKEMFFDQAVVASGHSVFAWSIPVLATLAGVFSVAYSLRFIHDVFFNGEPIDLPKWPPHEPPRSMRIPVDLLVILCLAVGILPAYTVAPLLAVAVTGTLQMEPPYYSLSIWHGFNIPLLMSFIALTLGIVVYYLRHPLLRWYEANVAHRLFRKVYEHNVDMLLRGARLITRNVDRGALQDSIFWVLLTALLAGIAGFAMSSAPILGERTWLAVDPVSLGVVAILVMATVLTTILHRQRLVSLVILGAVGLVVSLSFIKFSAPDLALTQLSVEIVTVVLLMLALYFLPQYSRRVSQPWRKWRDATLAGALGLGAAILSLAVMSRDGDTRIAQYLLSNSKPGGGGTNTVNVILVDFRGFDTLGEIAVLAIAGLGIFALLQNLRLHAASHDSDGRLWSRDMKPPIFETFSRILFPLMLMVAVFIFLRGHNLPGGGFIAGLIAALAIVLQNLANGIDWTASRLGVDMHRLLAGGLLIATGTGLVSMVLGYPFLTSAFTYLKWPIVGKFEVASAMAFDTGVFFVVVGATVIILVELGKLSHAGQPQGKERN